MKVFVINMILSIFKSKSRVKKETKKIKILLNLQLFYVRREYLIILKLGNGNVHVQLY